MAVYLIEVGSAKVLIKAERKSLATQYVLSDLIEIKRLDGEEIYQLAKEGATMIDLDDVPLATDIGLGRRGAQVIKTVQAGSGDIETSIGSPKLS